VSAVAHYQWSNEVDEWSLEVWSMTVHQLMVVSDRPQASCWRSVAASTPARWRCGTRRHVDSCRSSGTDWRCRCSLRTWMGDNCPTTRRRNSAVWWPCTDLSPPATHRSLHSSVMLFFTSATASLHVTALLSLPDTDCSDGGCGRGSILLWRQCNNLCTSGFVDEVMFSQFGQWGIALFVVSSSSPGGGSWSEVWSLQLPCFYTQTFRRSALIPICRCLRLHKMNGS